MNIKRKAIVPLALCVLLAAGCNNAASNPSANTQLSAPAGSQPTAAAPTSGSQKFTDQVYYKYSYGISGSTLSADAKTALTGFTMSKQALADGNTQVTLTALKTEYHNQRYTLRPGDQLYFIEKFLGDDNTEANEEKNTMDDSAVVVDSQGNVISQPTVWSSSPAPTTNSK